MAEEEINKLIGVVRKFKPGAKLKHYIGYAQFPSFKSLEPSTRIDFDFPLTALVGPNGSGKSSVLHALWGMPYGPPNFGLRPSLIQSLVLSDIFTRTGTSPSAALWNVARHELAQRRRIIGSRLA